MTDSNLSPHLALELGIKDDVRTQVFERDNYQCQVCGTTGDNRLQIHHWRHFRSLGGGDTPDNLVTVCYADHSEIHLRTIDIVLHDVNGRWYPFVRRHRRHYSGTSRRT